MTMQYSDSKVEFTYPTSCRVEAQEEYGQYYIRNGKRAHVLLSIVPKETGEMVQHQAVLVPSPNVKFRKTVHDRFNLGGFCAAAVEFQLVNDEGQTIGWECTLYMPAGEVMAIIRLSVTAPGSRAILEEVVRTLIIKP